jgi:hypothetical protein
MHSCPFRERTQPEPVPAAGRFIENNNLSVYIHPFIVLVTPLPDIDHLASDTLLAGLREERAETLELSSRIGKNEFDAPFLESWSPNVGEFDLEAQLLIVILNILEGLVVTFCAKKPIPKLTDSLNMLKSVPSMNI